MKDTIVKNLHLIILLVALWNMYELYEAKELELSSLYTQKPILEAKIKRNKLKLKQIKQFKRNLKISKRRVGSVLEQLETVQKQLPAEINDTEVQRTMTSISNDLRIKNPSPSPLKEEELGFYFSKEYTFHAKGTFLQFLIFFEKLGETKRILNVKSLVLKSSEKIERTRFQILELSTVIESFRFNTSHREKTGNKDVRDVIK